MGKSVSFIIMVALLVLGLIIGLAIGNSKGYNNAKLEQQSRNIEEIRTELKTRENAKILDYLKVTAKVETKDEGSLFTTKYVQYFTGTLSNSATIATAKDVKLKVFYYSKTNSEIGNQEVTIYEFIKPGQTVNFRERINVPEKVAEVKYQILEAKPNL